MLIVIKMKKIVAESGQSGRLKINWVYLAEILYGI